MQAHLAEVCGMSLPYRPMGRQLAGGGRGHHSRNQWRSWDRFSFSEVRTVPLLGGGKVFASGGVWFGAGAVEIGHLGSALLQPPAPPPPAPPAPPTAPAPSSPPPPAPSSPSSPLQALQPLSPALGFFQHFRFCRIGFRIKVYHP